MRPNTKRSQDDKADESKEAPRIVWFKPTDKRVPLIAIPIEQAPEDFVSDTAAYENRLFVVSDYRHLTYWKQMVSEIWYLRDPLNAGPSLHFIPLVHSSAN